LTASLIQNAVNINIFNRLAGRRFLGELKLVLEEERPALNIKRMDEFNLLSIVHSELKFTPQMAELFGAIDSVISWFELLFLDEPYRRWMVYFLGLVEQLNMVEMEALCRKLEMLKKDQTSFLTMKKAVIEAMRVFNVRQKLSRGELYDFSRPMDTEALLFMMARTKNEVVKKSVSLYFTQLRSTKISTRGRDLKKMGYIPGPIYRKIMNELLKAKLNGLVQTARDENAYIRAHYPLPRKVALEEHEEKDELLAS
jgi:tRNA nucleotidyltransferase (CCA-adding enzyme)